MLPCATYHGCGGDYSGQSFLKSRPPSFPFLQLKLVNRTQLKNFTILWMGIKTTLGKFGSDTSSQILVVDLMPIAQCGKFKSWDIITLVQKGE